MDLTKMKEEYHSIAEKYLNGLNNGKVAQILELFDPLADIHSPLYGKCSAREFYQNLSDDTAGSITTLKQVIADPLQQNMALWFHYQWSLTNHNQVEFDCVDVIKLNREMKIIELHILYDTYPIRPFLR